MTQVTRELIELAERVEKAGIEQVERFVRGLHSTTSLLDQGVLMHDELGAYAAARTINSVYGQEWVWAFTGRRRREKLPSFMENHVPGSNYTAALRARSAATL